MEFSGMTDAYEKPAVIDADVIRNLGPLTPLVGIWEGAQGVDVAPTRGGDAISHYRERITFEPWGPVNNHAQTLYGLRYTTMIWRVGEEGAYHDEVGYWLWDPKAQMVMRCFAIPRGINILAGGCAAANARDFKLSAQVGSEVFGILSNPFLDQVFKTVRYDLEVRIHTGSSFSYSEDSQLRIHGQAEIYHHTDRNNLRRID